MKDEDIKADAQSITFLNMDIQRYNKRPFFLESSKEKNVLKMQRDKLLTVLNSKYGMDVSELFLKIR
jgi:hypothetical protein